MSLNCNTGCREKGHMVKCPICKEDYHIGIVHHCPTGVKT